MEEHEKTAAEEPVEELGAQKAAKALEAEASEGEKDGVQAAEEKTETELAHVTALKKMHEDEPTEAEEKKFINETANDLELNVRVANIMSRGIKLTLMICGAFVLLCGLALLLMNILLPVNEGEKKDFLFSIVAFVLGAVFLALGLMYGTLLRFSCKRLMQGKTSVITYTFGQEGYIAQSLLNDGTISRTRGKYEGLIACKEYRDGWLIYLNRTTLFAVRKDGMKEGTATELTTLLRERLGERYKTKSMTTRIF